MDQDGIRRLAAKKFAIGVNVGRKKERERNKGRKKGFFKKRSREKWYWTLTIMAVAASTILMKAVEIVIGQLNR